MTFEHDLLSAWCTEVFGVRPAARLFDAGHLSRVAGFRMPDGLELVVKERDPSERVLACLDVQSYLNQRAFPCPMPLAGPTLANGRLHRRNLCRARRTTGRPGCG